MYKAFTVKTDLPAFDSLTDPNTMIEVLLQTWFDSSNDPQEAIAVCNNGKMSAMLVPSNYFKNEVQKSEYVVVTVCYYDGSVKSYSLHKDEGDEAAHAYEKFCYRS